uniref:Uncharacterized protein n=1 Tax=Naja naja TaxID=35670 RepID=A0A8C6VF04_NAJNA
VSYRRDEMWSERYEYERLPRERLPPRPDVSRLLIVMGFLFLIFLAVDQEFKFMIPNLWGL